MQITRSNFSSPNLPKGPQAPKQQPEGPQDPATPPNPEPPQEPSVGELVYTGTMKVANRAIETALFYSAGGGTLSGCVGFSATLGGVTGALDSGLPAYKSGASKGDIAIKATVGGAVGAGSGALRGWGNYVMATAFGGGVMGALAAGAAMGTGEVIADALFPSSK